MKKDDGGGSRESVDCRVPWMFYNKNNKIKNGVGGRKEEEGNAAGACMYRS